MPAKKITTCQARLSELFDSLPDNDSAIAKTLGVSKQTISAWKTGARSPKKPMIEHISSIFNIDIAWIMGFDVPMRPPDKPIALDEITKNTTLTGREYVIINLYRQLPEEEQKETEDFVKFKWLQFKDKEKNAAG